MCLLFFFSTIQLTAGLCCRGVRGVYGAAERRHAAPAVIGDSFACCVVLVSHSAWFLTQTRFSGTRTDGRTDGRTDDDETPLPPDPFSSNRKPQRNSDLDFRLFAVSNINHTGFGTPLEGN